MSLGIHKFHNPLEVDGETQQEKKYFERKKQKQKQKMKKIIENSKKKETDSCEGRTHDLKRVKLALYQLS